MLYSLRVGFGSRPDESDLSLGEAQAQLTNPSIFVGVKTQKTSSGIEPWPNQLSLSLSERIMAATEYRRAQEAAFENKRLSEVDKQKQLRIAQQRFELYRIDAVHLAAQAIHGSSPVRQRFIHFWANHFTVGRKDSTEHTIGHLFQNVIEEGLNGKFSDLTYRVTKHPAMLDYLDNIFNVGENSETARSAGRKVEIGLNDNLARELLELHTVSPTAQYSETDIRNVAKILAGWGMIFNDPERSREDFRKAGIDDYEQAYFKRRAEPGDKRVFGKVYPSGRESLRLLIDDLASSRHTIRHLSYKLCKHFISDEPAESDMIAVMDTWKRTNGSLPEIHATVLERASNSTAPRFQWPLTWLLSVLRTSEATVIHGWDDVHSELLGNFGRMEYRAETLFNEMGQNFWSSRQPDGFSLNERDWISPELLERRMRLASMIAQHGRPKHLSYEIAKKINLSSRTKDMLKAAKSETDRFVLLTCSPEFMGA